MCTPSSTMNRLSAQAIYHDELGIIGLHLGLGLVRIAARITDITYGQFKVRHGGVGERSTFPGAVFILAGLLIAGRGAQKHTHCIVPDIRVSRSSAQGW
ncbi:hypothetical protein C8Q74DRAFT_1240268 [Fomes fomentarius]|nr:hypothetical protein C8Q74DRAFT_1240268 [Fomes fomentarius]